MLSAIKHIESWHRDFDMCSSNHLYMLRTINKEGLPADQSRSPLAALLSAKRIITSYL